MRRRANSGCSRTIRVPWCSPLDRRYHLHGAHKAPDQAVGTKLCWSVPKLIAAANERVANVNGARPAGGRFLLQVNAADPPSEIVVIPEIPEIDSGGVLVVVGVAAGVENDLGSQQPPQLRWGRGSGSRVVMQ